MRTQQLVGVGLGAVEFRGARLHELGAPAHEHLQVGLRGARRQGGCRRHGLTKGDEHIGIDHIGFGVLAFGAGKMPHPRGLEEAQGNLCGVPRAAEGCLVAAGGFEEDVDLAARLCPLGGREPLEDTGLAFGIVGETIGRAAQAELERGLGNVDARVEGGSEVVLTPTCKCEPRAGASRRCSFNGSSWEQWMWEAACSATHRTLAGHAGGGRGSSPSPPHELHPVRRPHFTDCLRSQRNKQNRHTRRRRGIAEEGRWASRHR